MSNPANLDELMRINMDDVLRGNEEIAQRQNRH